MKKAASIGMILLIICGCAATPPVKEKAEKAVVFYPPLPEHPRLQYLHSITNEDDLGATQSSFDEFLLGKTESEKSLGKAYDIGSTPGKIYVLDRTLKKLIFLDLENKTMDYVRDRRMGALIEPSGICVSGDGLKYVADMGRKQIVVFDRDNNFLRTYGSKELFAKPVDVTVYQNTVYVVDMSKNTLYALDKESGELVMTIGKTGFKEAEFYKPTHVVADGEGFIYVNDAFNYRIQKLDPEGGFVKSFGSLGDNIGAFARPKGLDVDREGHLYVADSAFENTQIFDAATGRLLLFFGGAGEAPGSMYLPAGVHVDYKNVDYFRKYADKDFDLEYVLYVGNYFGHHKLNIYGFGKWKGKE